MATTTTAIMKLMKEVVRIMSAKIKERSIGGKKFMPSNHKWSLLNFSKMNNQV